MDSLNPPALYTSRIPVLTVYTGPVLPWLGSSGGSAKGGKTIVITKQVDSASPALWSNVVVRNIHTVGHHVKAPPKGSGTVQQVTLGSQIA
jgi:hypothetical protein